MKIVAILPTRNENWVLGLSARALLMWVDEVIILDHASEIPVESGSYWDESDCSRVTVLVDNDPIWHEMAQRQRLLEVAREHSATHIVTVDADEIVSGNLLPSIRSLIERAPLRSVLRLPWICCRGSLYRQNADGIWAQQIASVGFRDCPQYRWGNYSASGVSGYDHHHREPMGQHIREFVPVQHGDGGILHLQYLSESRLRAKQYHYQLVERLRWPKKPVDEIRKQYSWSIYGATEPAEGHDLKPIPESWWEPYKQWLHYLQPESEPWYIPEIRRILRENPGIESGLDNFGVVV